MKKMKMIFQYKNLIDPAKNISDIVASDYRTAEIFREYEIDFCCGGKWPLSVVCESKNIDLDELLEELNHATRNISLPNNINFNGWDTDFLIDYILNIHHDYLKNSLPAIKDKLILFAGKHAEKFPYINELINDLTNLERELNRHMAQEEEIIFPYIRQLSHAYTDKEPYAKLLVRTLRKPLEKLMNSEHHSTGILLKEIRNHTNNYTSPGNSCTKHHVVFALLEELDNDLVQHVHLENNVLFPRAIAMERELLLNP